MSEQELYGEIMSEYSHGKTRIFRINTGSIAWQGEVISRTATRIVLEHYRAIKLGAPGISDLIGWSPANGRAVFTAIECKAKRGYLNPEQRAFLELVTRSGGRAGVARTVEDAGVVLSLPI